MEVAYQTDKGKLRTNNEDACRVFSGHSVFIVADGVGGNNSGELASKTAVDGIAQYIRKHPLDEVKTLGETSAYFRACFNEINLEVLESSSSSPETEGMATTIVVCYIVGNKMYSINVGDSRVYLFRDGKLSQITVDHTYVNLLLRAGVITPAEAENHEKRNLITRAIGADRKVRADVFERSIRPGDIIMMCTDGLYDEVTEHQIVSILGESSYRPMGAICDDLVEKANQQGGSDNITLICMKITEDDIDE